MSTTSTLFEPGRRIYGRSAVRECTRRPAATAASPAQVPGFTYIKSLGGIDEYQLDSNGLAVLLKTDHSAPVVTFQVTYRVGSRNEVTGTTGATHILEHLMFKGSENFNDPAGNSVKQYLGKVGGGYNATTVTDRTNYYATLGRDNLEGYIAIEADRMRNLWLRDADRQAEMTVVRNEYEQGENNPDSARCSRKWSPRPTWRSPITTRPSAGAATSRRCPSRSCGVLRHLLLARQRHRHHRGRRRSGQGAGAGQEILRRDSRAPQPIPRDVHRGAAADRRAPRDRKRAGELGAMHHRVKAPERARRGSARAQRARLDLERRREQPPSKALVDKSLATYAGGDIQPSHDPGSLHGVSPGSRRRRSTSRSRRSRSTRSRR